MQIFRHFGLKKPVAKLKSSAASSGKSFGSMLNPVRRLKAMSKEQKEQLGRQTVSLALVIGVAMGSVATVMAATRWASITLDGQAKPAVEITSTDTTDILKLAGVTAAADDLVQRKDEKSGNVDITVKTAKHVTVFADGKNYRALMHNGDTVDEALQKAGVTLGANDVVVPSRTAKVKDGMLIMVRRKFNVSVAADGKTTNNLVWEGTVSYALQQSGITLGPEDSPNVNPNTAVADGMNIKVNRVTYQNVTATEPIAFDTVTQKDDSLTAGTKSVKTDGQDGVKTIVSRQKLCDGNVVQSTVISSSVTKQPVSQVVAVGTKRVSSSDAAVCADGTLIDQNGNAVSYRKLISGRCSAYCTGTTTATGLPAAFGRVAVNPSLIPYGTRLYICSPDGGYVYGYAVAADTGGAAMSNSIVADLYYPSYAQCISMGSRTMNVYVLG